MARKFAHMSLVGDKELIAKLNGLGGKVYKKVVAGASRKAFAPVVKTAKEKAPKETGLLKKSMGVKQKRYPRAGRIVTLVGPRTGFKQEVTVKDRNGNPVKVTRDPVRYGHLVEFGTGPHSTDKGSKSDWNVKDQGKLKDFRSTKDDHPGAKAQPFMRPAFDGNEARAKSIMRSELAAGVVREARKSA